MNLTLEFLDICTKKEFKQLNKQENTHKTLSH